MTRILVAKNAGFCFGVQRAVDAVYEKAAGGGPIYTYGPVVHNESVIRDLEKKGVRILESEEDLKKVPAGTVIIRAHGVPASTSRAIEASGHVCLDATCPFVKRIHQIVEKESAQGREIVIIGAANHPEVIGICGWSHSRPSVIASKEEAQALDIPLERPVCVVSQTTFNAKKFEDLVDILKGRGYNITCVNTICNATHVRQSEAMTISDQADIMIVIGGQSSSNSAKLYEICRSRCPRTYFIQSAEDLHLSLHGDEELIGITAGASTPNYIIEEVFKFMSEMTFEQMLENSVKTVHAGETVKGVVIDVKPDEAILNIGCKSDGVLSRAEYTNDSSVDLTEVLHIGDELEVKVLKTNDGDGQVVLSYKRLAADRGNKRIEEAYNTKEVLKAVVTQVLSGGLSVVVEEVRVFIPASLVSDTFERDLSKYLGQEIEFVITEFNPHRRRYIGDRKQLLVARRAEMQKKLFETIAVGDVVEGTVKNITDFGAFVDLGGADGLLHISEMSWGRVENPRKVFHVGQQLRVLIKDIQGTKIALSLKFPDQNPWAGAAEKYAVGTVVTGRVARMTDFGAFVELEPGIDALLHVSQIAKEHIEKPSDVLKTGQEVTAKVVDFDSEKNKISLSIKQLLIEADRAKQAERRARENADPDGGLVDIEAIIASQKDEEE